MWLAFTFNPNFSRLSDSEFIRFDGYRPAFTVYMYVSTFGSFDHVLHVLFVYQCLYDEDLE